MTAVAQAPAPRLVAQRHDALKLAKAYCMARASDRQRVKAIKDMPEGRAALAEILEQPIAGHLRTLGVETFLLWAYRMHHDRLEHYLRAADVSPYRRLGDLTHRQRTVLASALRASDLDAWERARELELWSAGR